MNQAGRAEHAGALRTQLLWFIRLRWCAGGATIVGALVDHFWLRWHQAQVPQMLVVGLVILAYNALLWQWMKRVRSVRDTIAGRTRRALLGLAWAQIVLDLACLTVLAVSTGGTFSPLLGFYVFHMVFASLLLPAVVAYGSAAVAMGMLSAGLALKSGWPRTQDAQLMLGGWCLTLLLTVYLANQVTRSLRRQRLRLIRQNRRIHKMAEHLRRHQVAMVQHEKMVALGQMAAGVAHEIANPLASMDSLLQLMERRPGAALPPRTGAVPALREQVRRINTIVRQMTDFARPSQAEWRVVPLIEIVEKTLAMAVLDRRLERVTIDRQFVISRDPVRVRPNALQQVLLNLLLNAGDAMADTAEPRLEIITGRSGSMCSISIRDNGHGIRPEHMGRLFEPFFTTKPVGRGTGLGLSISYRLISDMGGEIDVRSTPGQGATFIIRLPCHGASGGDAAAVRGASRGREGQPADLPITEKFPQ
jgi:signal transduction histidine kinase